MSAGLAGSGSFPDRLFLGTVAPTLGDVEAIADQRRTVVDRDSLTFGVEYREEHSPLAFPTYRDAVENLERVATSLNRDEALTQKNPTSFRLQPIPGLARLLRLGYQARYTPDLAGWTAYLSDLHPVFAERLAALHRPSAFPEAGRNFHTLIVAPTGWGKSELLKTIIYHYVTHATGAVLVLDPGGDLVREVARWPEVVRRDRLVLIDPTLRRGFTAGINPLDGSGLDFEEDRKEVAAHWALTLGEVANDLSFNMQRIAGHCARVLLSMPGATLRDFMKLLELPDRANRGQPPADERGRELWERSRNYPDYDVATFFRLDFEAENFVSTRVALRGRIDWILQLPHAAPMLCAPRPVNLKAAFEAKKIVLVNLSAFRRVGAPAVGRLLIALTNKIGRSRGETDKESRTPVQVFVDEVTTMVSPQMIEVLSELRKFGVHLTMAQQVEGQGFDKDGRRALKVNTGCKFLGGDAAVIEDVAELVGLKKVEVPLLREHEFLVQWRGQSELRRLRVHSDLADENRAVPAREWEACVERQVSTYYRQIEQPAPLEPWGTSPAPSTEDAGPSPKRAARGKKRELKD